jgi:hypothetical protein
MVVRLLPLQNVQEIFNFVVFALLHWVDEGLLVLLTEEGAVIEGFSVSLAKGEACLDFWVEGSRLRLAGVGCTCDLSRRFSFTMT